MSLPLVIAVLLILFFVLAFHEAAWRPVLPVKEWVYILHQVALVVYLICDVFLVFTFMNWVN